MRTTIKIILFLLGVSGMVGLSLLVIAVGNERQHKRDKEKHYWLQPTTELTNPVDKVYE